VLIILTGLIIRVQIIIVVIILIVIDDEKRMGYNCARSSTTLNVLLIQMTGFT